MVWVVQITHIARRCFMCGLCNHLSSPAFGSRPVIVLQHQVGSPLCKVIWRYNGCPSIIGRVCFVLASIVKLDGNVATLCRMNGTLESVLCLAKAPYTAEILAHCLSMVLALSNYDQVWTILLGGWLEESTPPPPFSGMPASG